ncbi:MAG TPA: DUF2844 domain-containing protein [Janthinobacterium sp.]|nr:DUF2844 domain-containing protein [Janthinobacterium sp.]
MRSALVLLLLITQCASSHAALGSLPSNFGVQQNGIKARSLAAASGAYHTVETTLDSGTVVREFVNNSSGTVFAVSWDGPFMPDLQTLLGTNFSTLTDAAASKPKAGHSQLSIDKQDVVIVSGGHMRAYTGRAWITSQFPAGVSATDID